MFERRLFRRALVWVLASGGFFFVAYSGSNWMAAQRAYVPSAAFAWERAIPFLAWTIVPYWSTDLLYAFSFFLCKDQRELDVHGRRLLAAQVICFTAFLLFPLRFAFVRPPATGGFELLFQALGSFDRPFNQAPSLHLALTTILWAKYSEHSRGLTRLFLFGWLGISGLSTLTTYQHHFIDIPTGIWVGLLCIMWITGQPIQLRAAISRRALGLASLYLGGAFAFAFVGWRWGGLAWLGLWPAGSLLIVAIAYATSSPQILRNQFGERVWIHTILLAPYFAAARLNSWWWTRNDSPAHEIVPGIWLGRSPTRSQREQLRIASVVDVAPELVTDTRGIACRRIPMLDLLVPSTSDLESAVRAIDSLKDLRPTLVCCALGYSRSAIVTVAWLVASRRVTSIASAIDLVRGRRQIVLGRDHHAQLESWAQERSVYDA